MTYYALNPSVFAVTPLQHLAMKEGAVVCEKWRRRSVLTLWLPVNLLEHALVPVSGLVDALGEARGGEGRGKMGGWERAEGKHILGFALLELMWANCQQQQKNNLWEFVAEI